MFPWSWRVVRFVNFDMSEGMEPAHKVKSKQRKMEGGELIWRDNFASIRLQKKELRTSQLVVVEIKILQVRQFRNLRRNSTYTKSSQNSEKRSKPTTYLTGQFCFHRALRLQKKELLTSQLVREELMRLQVRQFRYFRRNWSCAKSSWWTGSRRIIANLLYL